MERRPDDVRPADGSSWIYIATQASSRDLRAFAESALQHFNGTLDGRHAHGRTGGMGRAPLAVTMNEGVCMR